MNIGYAESIKLYNYTCFVFHDVDLIPENDRIMYDCRDSPRHLSSAVDKFKYKWVIKQQHIKFSLRKSMQALLITKISPSLVLPSLLFYLFSLFFLGEMGVGDTKLTLWFFFLVTYMWIRVVNDYWFPFIYFYSEHNFIPDKVCSFKQTGFEPFKERQRDLRKFL